MRSPTRFWAVLFFFFAVTAAAEDYTAPGVTLTVGDPNGVRFKPLSSLEVGDSLSVELTGARPRATVEMLLQDDRGREWSYSRVHSDARGGVPRTLFWYQSGVIGTTARRTTFRPDPSLLTFDDAERFFAGSTMRLTVREREGPVLATRDFRPRPRATPFVYPSNGSGVLENAINARDESLYVTGRNFPAGATVQLFLVPNRFGWALNDSFEATVAKTITLGANETSFTAQVLAAGTELPGTFDIIARTGSDTTPIVQGPDIVSFGEDTGVVLYYIIFMGNVLIESAGRMADATAYFEFSNYFEKGEDVYGAVDPTDVPADNTGGNYAAHWVVADQPDSYWESPNPALADVSGDGPEIHRVKFWCINGTRVKLWSAATQVEPIKGYDVIVDFGATPANNAADFMMDSTYNKGLDFIDGYFEAGFSVYEPPDATGPYPVGTVEYLDENGISGISDPNGVTGPAYPIKLGWARIMYPAQSAGTGTDVAAGGPFPVAVFLHGNHANCHDGSFFGVINYNCAVANRIPSHEGYNYIMERLASQGIVSVSINAFDIQGDQSTWNYDVRGRLVLKYLDKLREWTTLGNDPFNLFNGKLDMSKIALSGHSRGGEGVVAADVLNATWPMPHSIVAVNAIAPTDQNPSGDYLPSAPYFLLLGARDGDLDTMQGLRTYDHAYPQGMPNRKMKATAFVYGANHNYFNTIWTPTAEAGMPNPWSGAYDDCNLGTIPNQPDRCQLKMTGEVQRQVARSTIAAFFRWHLQNLSGYREVLTGVLEPAAMDNANVFWTFQDAERFAIDDFEQQPLDATQNSVLGMASALGASLFEERLFNYNNVWTSYNPPPPTDFAFFHDTLGLKLQAPSPITYETEIPAGSPARDVSMYTHLTVRIGKKVTALPTAPGPDVTVYVNLEDGQGDAGPWADASNFQRIPHPFLGSERANLGVMTGVRIPLQIFTRNNSQVDLTDIAKITIMIDGTEIGLDDIEFGK